MSGKPRSFMRSNKDQAICLPPINGSIQLTTTSVIKADGWFIQQNHWRRPHVGHRKHIALRLAA